MPTKPNKHTKRTEDLLRGKQQKPVRAPPPISRAMIKRGFLEPVWYGNTIVYLSEPKEK